MSWLCIALLIGFQDQRVGTPEPRPTRFEPEVALQRPADRTICFYEVRDLALEMAADFEPMELGSNIALPARFDVRKGPSEVLTPWKKPVPGLEPPRPETLARGMSTLADLIEAYIHPPLEGSGDALRATPEGTLVANLTPERKAWVDAFLAANRTFNGQVRVRAHVLEGPHGMLAEWKLAPSATLATPAELGVLLDRIERDGRFTSAHAPSLTALPNQRFNVAVVEETAYVADWTVRVVEPGHKEIADPEVELVRSGLVLDLRASPLPDGFLGLIVAFEQVELKGLSTATLHIGTSREQEVEVALPETMTVRFSTTLALAPGASAVLVTPHTDGEHDIALILTAERIERSMEPASPK